MNFYIVLLIISGFVLVACEGNVFSLKEGDCFNGGGFNTEEGIEVRDVELVSCDDPHENEVYAVFELPDSIWKGDDYVWEQVMKGCRPRFETFVGIKYDRSTLFIDAFFPQEQSWKEIDDRQVTCSVGQESAMKVSGSAKGSRR